jgi:regulator of sirC expression with transglutaminase-like and TPR domain
MSGPSPGPAAGETPNSTDIQQALRRLADIPDEQLDLADAALLLAALERPRVALDRYRLHLRDLADGVARAGAERKNDGFPLESRAATLLAVIAGEHGYRGDDLTYDDLQNASLMRVIDRRKGLPVALGILYIHAARAQGWRAFGLNFPAHFLVALDSGGARVILDPFAGRLLADANELRAFLKAVTGQTAELSPRHYTPLGNRAVLLRLQNNIKARLAGRGHADRAAAVLERMLLFAPAEVELWREAGALHAQAGNLQAALAALEHYVAMARDGMARQQAIELIQSLRRRLN